MKDKDIRCPYCDSKKVAEWADELTSTKVRRFICMTCHQQWHMVVRSHETTRNKGVNK